MAIYKPILDGAKTSDQIKVHKSFALTSGSYGVDTTQYISGSSVISGSFYDSLKASFYLSSSNLVVSGADWTSKFNNPYFNLGYYPDEPYIYRNKFNISGSVVSISQRLFGERIKRKSFTLVDTSTAKEIILKDDGYGNIYSTNAKFSSSVSPLSSSDNYVGNIFYDKGIITITETGSWSGSILYTDVAAIKTNQKPKYTVYFDSTQTIHVKEITFKLNPRDLNSTNNPTARTTISGSFKGSSAKMYSPLLMSKLTGSGWDPYFTTIGFYNKSDDIYGHEFRPVMVAKFPQAIRNRTDVPIIFKIRYDY